MYSLWLKPDFLAFFLLYGNITAHKCVTTQGVCEL